MAARQSPGETVVPPFASPPHSAHRPWCSPQTLGVDEAEERVIAAEEALIDTRIQEAENQLAMLRTEAKVLELRKQQQQANAARAAAAQATANAASKEPSEATPPQ